MKTPSSRRSFLKTSLAATAAIPFALHSQAATAPAKPAARALPDSETGLSIYELGPQIWIRWNNRPVTCYRAHASQKYPYLYPLSGPVSGLSLTSETTAPFPHHRSLFFGCDRVNGGNYWQEGYEKGQIISTGPKVGALTANSVEILDECQWKKTDGPVIMKDRRKIMVTMASEKLRFIDWEIAWQAVEDITIQKTNHSLFSARAALDITPKGGGQLVNAEGDTGEKGTFGKASAWCDFSGKREGTPGTVEGIAIFEHPKNSWAEPARWFTRDYGFFSSTPMNFIAKEWKMEAGKEISLRYRVVLHAGDAREADLAALHKQWVG